MAQVPSKTIDGANDSSLLEPRMVDPVQLVYSIVKDAENESDSDSDSDSDIDDNIEEEDPELTKNDQVRLDSTQPQSRLVRKETKEFLQTLHKYLDCRRQMDSAYAQVDELETLANFDLQTDSGGIQVEVSNDDDDDNNGENASASSHDQDPNVKNHGRSLGYKPEYQQQNINAVPVRTLNELYEAAEVAFPIYQQLVFSMMEKVHPSFIVSQEDGNDGDMATSCGDGESVDNRSDTTKTERNGVSITFAPLKGKTRAQEKARDDYSQRNPDPGVSWLFDIVRGSISFTSADQMISVLQMLQDDPSIHVVKAKNRFRNPGLSGYRDWNVHIRIQVPKNGFKKAPSDNDGIEDEDRRAPSSGGHSYFHHICEIQMHHQALQELEKEVHSHNYYEFFRSYFAGATTTLQERLDDLELIDEGFSLPEGIDDDAFLDTLLNGKPKDCDPDVKENEDGGGHDPLEPSREEKRLIRLARLFRLHLNENGLALRIHGKLFATQLEKYGDKRHIQIALTYDRIGNVVLKQGKLDAAMVLHQHACEIKKEKLGELHLSLGESYKSLAEVLEKQGRLTEALAYCQKSVDLYKELKGEESFEEGFVFGGMAAILRKQDKFDEALELYKKAVRINIHHNGEDCTSVAYVYNGMAWIYKHQGDLDQAMALFQRSHEITKRMFGDQHSSLSFTYNGIADIYRRQNKLEEALEVYEKSMALTKRRNGWQHPAVYFIHSKMCKILKKLGREDEISRRNQKLQKRESKRNSKTMQGKRADG